MKALIAILLISLSLFSSTANASFMMQYSFLYFSDSDDVEEFSYSKMNNMIFVGASIDRSQQIFLGQSIQMWSKSHEVDGGDVSEISITELGPRIIYFLDQARRWGFSATYNPYCIGTRTVAGQEETISGSSYMASMGYQLYVTKTFQMGASINYYGVSISEKSISNTETDVSESYSGIIPMLEFAMKFK